MKAESNGISRREFLDRTSKVAGGVMAVGALSSCASTAATPMAMGKTLGANDRINVALVGINGRGGGLLNSFADIKGVHIKTLCDIDERVLGKRAKSFQEKHGYAPATEWDMRKVFEDKNIDAVVFATPNHWHALGAIWACQAGKHVYVEKPCSHNVFEGRKMVEAARKYKCLVQVGFQNRSIVNVRNAMKFLADGGIGDVYMAKGSCYKPRDAFPVKPDSEPPKEVHYDMWLGPAPMQPYNEGKFHYQWHWHWDTGCGDIGNQGPHQFDVARWGLGQDVHPCKIRSFGGYYKYTPEQCTQETANTQIAIYEYPDGKILQFEVRGLYTGGEADQNVKIGNIFFGTEGWMSVNGSNWKTYMGRKNTPGPSSESKDVEADPMNLTGAGGGGHFNNFIAALRSGNRSDQTCDIEVGHMSSALPHLGNISYRLGRDLTFDGAKEKFKGDSEANKMLTRKYRKPYVVPKNV
jgi:predicted dehydrogenase